MHTDIIQYYDHRAEEFEDVYQIPERQSDLQRMTRQLQEWFRQRALIEVACGTGYWTERIAETAQRIFGIDPSEAALSIAKKKTYAAPVAFEGLSWTDLPSSPQGYEALFGGFIWSHIPRESLPEFAQTCLSQVPKGGTLVFTDNTWIEGNSTPIFEKDKTGNTYQRRTLKNGSFYKVLKNYFSREELEQFWSRRVRKFEYIELEYYWLIKLER